MLVNRFRLASDWMRRIQSYWGTSDTHTHTYICDAQQIDSRIMPRHCKNIQQLCLPWHKLYRISFLWSVKSSTQKCLVLGHMVHTAQPRSLPLLTITHTWQMRWRHTPAHSGGVAWRLVTDVHVTDLFSEYSGFEVRHSTSPQLILYHHQPATHTHTHTFPGCSGNRRDKVASARRASDLLMMPLICESFSICWWCRRLSLSSRRLWYCSRILLVCCSCECSRRSYSSSLRWDIIRRSFREWISSSYSRTCTENSTEYKTSMRGNFTAITILAFFMQNIILTYSF